MRNTTVAAIAVLLGGCTPHDPGPPTGTLEVPTLAAEVVAPLRANPLGDAAAAQPFPAAAPPGGAFRMDAAPARAETLVVRVSKTAKTLLAPRLEAAFEAAHPQWDLEMLRSSDRSGIEEVMAQRAAAALVTTAPSPNEQAHGIAAHALGHYIATVVVHRDHPLQSLTTERVREVLTGQVSAWSRVAYQRGTIRLIFGPHSPLSLRAAAMFIPGDHFPHDAERAESEPAVVARIRQDQQALGVVGLRALQRSHGVRPLSIQGVAPDLPAFISGRYRYGCTLHVTYRQRPGAGTESLLAFLASASGRDILGERLMLP